MFPRDFSMGRERFLPRCNLLYDLGQSSSALVPQFPLLGLISVLFELMSYFTTCIVISSDMGEVSIEGTQPGPITYQERPCRWHDGHQETPPAVMGQQDTPGCHPGAKDGHWTFLLFSSRGRGRLAQAHHSSIDAGEST